MSNDNQNICTCGCCEGAEHVTPLNVENNPGLSALQYRVGTHSSFKESMLRSVSGNTALAALGSRSGEDMFFALPRSQICRRKTCGRPGILHIPFGWIFFQ